MSGHKSNSTNPTISTISVVTLSVLVLLWMSVIFFFSAQPAEQSAKLSGTFSGLLQDLFRSIFGLRPPDFVDFILSGAEYAIRKIAHFAEYLILGVLVISLVKRLGLRRVLLVSMIVCTLYAVSDELHQAFVPGRALLAGDMLLDACASLAGVLLIKRRQK